MDFQTALTDEIRRIRERLALLMEHGASNEKTRQVIRTPAKANRTRKPARKSNPKVQALRRAQGQYMGLVRNLTPAQKKAISEIRVKKGMRAAIAEAKRRGKAT